MTLDWKESLTLPVLSFGLSFSFNFQFLFSVPSVKIGVYVIPSNNSTGTFQFLKRHLV